MDEGIVMIKKRRVGEIQETNLSSHSTAVTAAV